MENNQEFMVQYLNKLGCKVNTKAFEYIDLANEWYRNKKTKFHERETISGVKYDLERLNMGKRLCADDANLCEVIEINAQTNTSDNDIILDVLKSNNFDVMYRKQLEQMSAAGTVGAYLRIENADLLENGEIRGGKIVINWVEAKNIVILNCVNNDILECAFMGGSYDIQGSKYSIVSFKLNNDKKYVCRTAYFDENGKFITETTVTYGEVKPFAIMRVAEVNNLEEMAGYGLPKLFNAIPHLQILDMTFNMWFRDIDKSDKMVFLSKELGKYNSETSKYELPSQECKKIFLHVDSSSLPNKDLLVQEYNPVVRINDVRESMELALSMLSLMFGFGTRKYTFEDGRIVTATEYIGSRQDAMQEVNKQRFEAEQYISGIVKAIRWFKNALYNTDLKDDERNIDFDDTYIVDKEARAESMRNDALSFDIPQLTLEYFMTKYNLSKKEAQAWLDNAQQKEDGDGDEE